MTIISIVSVASNFSAYLLIIYTLSKFLRALDASSAKSEDQCLTDIATCSFKNTINVPFTDVETSLSFFAQNRIRALKKSLDQRRQRTISPKAQIKGTLLAKNTSAKITRLTYLRACTTKSNISFTDQKVLGNRHWVNGSLWRKHIYKTIGKQPAPQLSAGCGS